MYGNLIFYKGLIETENKQQHHLSSGTQEGNMKKRIMAAVLSTVLAMSALAGCGGAPAAPAAAPAEEAKEEAKEEAPAAE